MTVRREAREKPFFREFYPQSAEHSRRAAISSRDARQKRKSVNDFGMNITLYPLPDLVEENIAPDAAIFIDVLRATTTMTAALAAGAARIIPIADPQEALRLKKRSIESGRLKEEDILLGGERRAVRIAGFDLGNSPKEYTAEKVAGKTIFFSTTNGTRAILSLRAGRTKKFLGSFAAAGALTRRITGDPSIESLAIICAGTDRQYTEEDLLLAGYFVEAIASSHEKRFLERDDFESAVALSTAAQTYRRAWRQFTADLPAKEGALSRALGRALKESRGGQNLVRAGLAGDIADCYEPDRFDLVAEYRLGEIVRAEGETP